MPTSESLPQRMIDAGEVATILKVSTRTVWRLVSADELPQPIRFGGNVRWQLADIEAWIEAQANAARASLRRRRKLH